MQSAMFSYQFYLSVRPSVWLSSAGNVFKRVHKIVHFLADLLGSLQYFLESHRHYTFPRGTPLAWALNALGVGKYWTFLRTHRSYRKQYEKGPQLLWITDRKSKVIGRSGSVPTTLSDLERRDARDKFFWRSS